MIHFKTYRNKYIFIQRSVNVNEFNCHPGYHQLPHTHTLGRNQSDVLKTENYDISLILLLSSALFDNTCFVVSDDSTVQQYFNLPLLCSI